MTSKGGAAPVAPPDLAYLVHEADNELLRYSLRSIHTYAAGMFRKVWIVGVLPEWVTGVGHIPTEYAGEKFADIRAKVSALCADKRVAARVVIMNDDYMATEPVQSWDAYHMGPTSEYLAREAERGRKPQTNTWIAAVANTAAWMAEQGHGDIDCFEGHVPLEFRRRALGKVLAEYPAGRSCDYPGFYPVAGSAPVAGRAINAKVGPSPAEFLAKLSNPGMPGWISTNDAGFAEGMVGGYIRGMFRTPSPHERT